MTIIKHELRCGRMAFFIWTGIIGILLLTCIILFPEMREQMEEITDVFSGMGAFTSAFGMDKLNFGTLIGYYAVECGNVLGLGGAFFAALTAAGMLAKEERDRTAEFLLTHPLSRKQIVAEKLAGLLLQIVAMNLLIYLLAIASMAFIGESIPWKEVNLLHLAYFLMQLSLAGICFGLSAFLKKGSAGIGLGVAALAYFLNLIANITESVKFLKHITPFGFCDGADIVTEGKLNLPMVAIGLGLGAIGIAAAFWKYGRKDIA